MFKKKINFFLKAIPIGKSSIDGKNSRGLILSILLGKFKRLLAIIKLNNFTKFSEELGKDFKKEDDRDIFDALNMKYEIMREEFVQGRMENYKEKMYEFCKQLISCDLIVSEIIRIVIIVAVNLRFCNE